MGVIEKVSLPENAEPAAAVEQPGASRHKPSEIAAAGIPIAHEPVPGLEPGQLRSMPVVVPEDHSRPASAGIPSMAYRLPYLAGRAGSTAEEWMGRRRDAVETRLLVVVEKLLGLLER